MASNPPCMANDGESAVFTGTFFDSGQSVTLCNEHLVAFCTTMLAPSDDEAPDDAEQLAWLEAHREQIEAAIGEGLTLSDAIEALMASEALAAELADDSPAESN